jgi:hypothetical protein
MPRHRRELPATVFRGGELRWLMTGILVLVVIFMLIARLREPGALNWLANFNHTPANPQTPSPAASLPKATGETDEDPDQAETAKEEYQAITDGTVGLGKEEMSPYNRLVFWVKNQSFARLWARAKKNLAYTYLYDDAKQYRGELVALDVTLALVNDAGKNDDGIPLHEVFATTKQSGDRLYVFIVVDLPAKLPIGRNIHEPARFAGYFLKVHGYHSALSKPGQPPEKAPLLIGRLEWTPATAVTDDNAQEWIWGSAALGLIAVVLIARFLFTRMNHHKEDHRNILTPPPDAVIPVDRWLEESGFPSLDGGKSTVDDGENPSSPNGP